jgi:hypothetical protein
MAKNRVTKVLSPSKGVILQSRKFSTEKWPNVVYAFETNQVNVPTGIEGVEIPDVTTNLISYVRMDLLAPETIAELQNKIKTDRDIMQ